MPLEIGKIELPIRSSRIKKAKVVFDPSENYLPKKRKLSTASLSPITTSNENAKRLKRNRLSLSLRRNSMIIPKRQQQQLERQQETKQKSERQQQEPKERRQKQQYVQQRYSMESQSSDGNNRNRSILKPQVSDHHDVCYKCEKFETRKNKILISCKNCNKKVHLECLDINFKNYNLVEKLWRCKNCTTCKNCGETRQAGYLVTCCECVDSFHYNCHKPKIPRNLIDKSKWNCYNCSTIIEQNLLLDNNPVTEKMDNESNSSSSPESVSLAVSALDIDPLSYRLKLKDNKYLLSKGLKSRKTFRHYSIDSNEPEIQEIMQQLSDNENGDGDDNDNDDDEQISILSAPLLSDSSPLPSLSSSSSISSLAQSPCSSTLPSSLSTSPLDFDLHQQKHNVEFNEEEQNEEEQNVEEHGEEEQNEEEHGEEEQNEEEQSVEEQNEEELIEIEHDELEHNEEDENQVGSSQGHFGQQHNRQEHNEEDENQVGSSQQHDEQEHNRLIYNRHENIEEDENQVGSSQDYYKKKSDREDYNNDSDDSDDNNYKSYSKKFRDFFASNEEIPDISDWSCEQLVNYVEEYLPKESKLLRDQEIDGRSCLLLKRVDIINGLSLQLGSALRLYSVVVALQTRQRDISVTWM